MTGCAAEINEKPVIYTTVYPVEFIVSELIGDNAMVKSIIPAGGDPHSFEPTQQDIRALADSNIYFYLGLHIESMAEDISKALENENVVSVRLVDYFYETMVDDGIDNEHIWINPLYNIEISKGVSAVLVEEFPEVEDEILLNLSRLTLEFEKIDQAYFDLMEKYLSGNIETDIKRDTIIVSHDSFAYYERYGIKSIPVKDESHTKDPTQLEIAMIINTAIEKGISTVLYDQNTPSLPLDVIKKELGADSKVISNLSIRTHDQIRDNKNLIDLMLENLDVLKSVLS